MEASLTLAQPVPPAVPVACYWHLETAATPLVGRNRGDRRWSLRHDGRLRRNDLPVRISAGVTGRMRWLTSHLSPLTSHLLPLTFLTSYLYLSPLTSHLSPLFPDADRFAADAIVCHTNQDMFRSVDPN